MGAKAALTGGVSRSSSRIASQARGSFSTYCHGSRVTIGAMTSLNRVVLEWAGNSVKGRAVTVLHYSASDNAAPPMAAIRTAFEGLKASLPAGVTIQYPAAGDVINDTTGDLVGVWSAAQQTTTTMTGGPNAAAGVGACVSWSTGGIVSGTKGPRRLRGRTFIVPLCTDSYEANGTLNTPTLGVLSGFATALQASGPLAIWHRPSSSAASDGNSYGVQSFRVNDKVAYLSSRRD